MTNLKHREVFEDTLCCLIQGTILPPGGWQEVSHDLCVWVPPLYQYIWRNTDIGGENAPDSVRGPYNEGGWWFERVGTFLTVSMFPSILLCCRGPSTWLRCIVVEFIMHPLWGNLTSRSVRISYIVHTRLTYRSRYSSIVRLRTRSDCSSPRSSFC